MGNVIEGDLGDAPMVLVDDILNSSASAEKARAVLAAAGRKIERMFVVIDYRSRAGLAWRERHGVQVRITVTHPSFPFYRPGRRPPSELR